MVKTDAAPQVSEFDCAPQQSLDEGLKNTPRGRRAEVRGRLLAFELARTERVHVTSQRSGLRRRREVRAGRTRLGELSNTQGLSLKENQCINLGPDSQSFSS